MKTADLAADFLRAKEAQALSWATLYGYEIRLRSFAAFSAVLPVDPGQVEEFLVAQGPTAETRDSYFRLLRNFYRWLERRGVLDRQNNPLRRVEAPRLAPKEARWFATEDVWRLLSYPGHTDPMRSLLYLLADTGLRLGEALSITPERFIGEDLVKVAGKAGERVLPVSPMVTNRVLTVLPWPWASADSASHQVRKAFWAAGFTGRRASAISLRHTFGQLWEGDETALQGIFGHTTPLMIHKHYRRYNLLRARRQHRQHSPVAVIQEAHQLRLDWPA